MIYFIELKFNFELVFYLMPNKKHSKLMESTFLKYSLVDF